MSVIIDKKAKKTEKHKYIPQTEDLRGGHTIAKPPKKEMGSGSSGRGFNARIMDGLKSVMMLIMTVIVYIMDHIKKFAILFIIILMIAFFAVDINPPAISNPQPENQSIVTSSPIILGVDTNEKAECRYSQNLGMLFNDMLAFENTNSTEHKSSIEVNDSTTYDYYIKCMDISDGIIPKSVTGLIISDVSDDYHITFTAEWNNPPIQPSNILPETTHDQTPTISWSPSSDSDGDSVTYHINAGTSKDGKDLLNDVTTTGLSYDITKKLDYDTTIYVSIYADDGELTSSPAEAVVIVKNNHPNPPTDISPSNGMLTHSPTQTIIWTSGNDSDGDSVHDEYAFDDNNDWSDKGIAEDSDITVETKKTQSLLLWEKTYYFRIRTCDNFGLCSEWVEYSFTPTNSPTSLYPEDEAEVYTTQVEMKWETGIDNTKSGPGYDEWQFDDNNNWSDPNIAEDSDITGETSRKQSVFFGTTYYWRVRTCYTTGNETECSSWVTQSFTPAIKPTELGGDVEANVAPSSPTGITPSRTSDKTPTLRWTKGTDADGDNITTHISIGTRPGGNDLINDHTTTSSRYLVPRGKFSRGNTYYIRIWSTDGRGGVSEYTDHTIVIEEEDDDDDDFSEDIEDILGDIPLLGEFFDDDDDDDDDDEWWEDLFDIF